jgi:cytochrome c-type biogenesis protein CcmE
VNIKIILAAVVIVVGLVFGAVSFVESNVEYTNIYTAMESARTVQVVGEWVKERGTLFDPTTTQFTFHMRDDDGNVMRVEYTGGKPNNFEIATSIVVKGRYTDGLFRAKEILTKCPSKYEGDAESVKKTL